MANRNVALDFLRDAVRALAREECGCSRLPADSLAGRLDDWELEASLLADRLRGATLLADLLTEHLHDEWAKALGGERTVRGQNDAPAQS